MVIKFAERLRARAGMTQAQLADASDLPIGSVRNFEQGQGESYWQVVFRLADALGVDCSAFKNCIDAGQADRRR
ncbi:MAG TPA: helix-turn-helix transcriptional regulator [Gemmataceae bacterium]|jgi:transcriptional regulator with XRE-family HTH domain